MKHTTRMMDIMQRSLTGPMMEEEDFNNISISQGIAKVVKEYDIKVSTDTIINFDDDLAKTFAGAKARFCVMSFTTDWRFSPARSRELVDALMAAKKDVCYLEIDAPQGHDAFLIPIPRYLQAFSNYMNRITL